MSSTKTQFYAKKLFELSGFLPIGAFLVEHLYTNYQVVGPGGQERFDEIVRNLQNNPLIIFAEIGLIGMPLLYHALYGIFVAQMARPNVGSYGYLRNWTYFFQRITGGILLVYICYHVWNTRLFPHFASPDHPLYNYLQPSEGHHLVSTSYMHAYLNEAHWGIPVVWIYFVGVAAAVFHFANGIWNFLIHWGLTVSPRSQQISGLVCGLIGVTLLALGYGSLLTFTKIG